MVINKKKILITVVIIIVILLILSFFYFIFLKKQEQGEIFGPKSRTLEEILREDLTAPSDAENKISQDLINTISAPAKKKIVPVSAEIIKSLTAPTK